MKNLLTLFLLVISLLASGQSNSQSLEVEIKYWKSIAESNDTVAYREYLQRYGEDGLYKDEAITRITLLKNSGKQAQSKGIECCFYTPYKKSEYDTKKVEYVIRFNANQDTVWFKHTNYDAIRANLAVSRDFYENQAILTMSRESSDYQLGIRTAEWYTSYVKKHKKLPQLSDYQYAYWQEAYLYNYQDWDKQPHTKSQWKSQWKTYQANLQLLSPEYYKNAWTKGEEYQYSAMKSTLARDVYFKRDNRDNLGTMQGYRYVAFSKDKSSFIMWFEEDDNLDGVIREKREYKRVPKEELLPKAVNYDFLNE